MRGLKNLNSTPRPCYQAGTGSPNIGPQIPFRLEICRERNVLAAVPACHATSHLANGYWAATTLGFKSARYATQLENWLRLRAGAEHLLHGRCGAVRKEKSVAAVYVSSGKSQHDGHCQ